MSVIKFTVSGIPQSKLRERVCSFGGRAGLRKHPKTELAERSILGHALAAHPAPEPLTVPLGLHCCFWMPRPKSHFNKKGEVKVGMPYAHTSKPDIDNLTKAVLDALNGVFWTDDKQVVLLNCQKLYTKDVAKTEVSIVPWENE